MGAPVALVSSTKMNYRARKPAYLYGPPETPPGLLDASEVTTKDWRWERAKFIYDRLKTPADYKVRRSDDPIFVRSVLPFYFEYQDATNDVNLLMDLRRRHPAMVWARELKRDYKIQAWLLEALVCADVPDEDIARELVITPAHVWWYEKMFFDVRAFLDYPNWMITKVFAPAKMGRIKIEDYFWKAIAWKHGLGEEGLQSLINPVGGMSPELSNLLIEVIRKKMLLDTAVALESRSINSFNENFAIDQFQKALETPDNDGPGGGTPMEKHLSVFLDCFARNMRVAPLDSEFNGIEGLSDGEAPPVNLFDDRRKQAAREEAEQSGGPQ